MVDSDLSQIQRRLREELPLLSQRFDVDSLRLFGSRVRQEHRPDSDLDVLVNFRRVPGLFRFVELENHLSEVLGVKVDLVMTEALKPRIRERILHEVVSV